MPQDIEKIAALSQEIGPAPVTVTSESRGLVRKWLTANGASYSAIANLPVADLSRLYNDDAALTRFLAADEATQTAASAPAPEKTSSTVVTAPQQQPAMSTPTTEQQKALAALLATLTPQEAPLNESRIIELIQQHTPKAPTVTVEVRGMEPGKLVTLPEQPRHKIFPTILTAIQAENVFIVGPAGSGKTTLAEQVASALSVPFFFTGAVASEYKLTGFVDAHGRTVRTAFREAYETGGVFLFDEIDGSSPSALLAFNAALSNGQFDFPDGTVKRHKDFYCIASGNTWGSGASREYIGRNQLDAASLDRFVKLAMDYDEDLERAISAPLYKHADLVANYVQAIRRAVARLSIRHVVSPRVTMRLCKLLALSMPFADANSAAFFSGVDKDAATKIKDDEEVKAARSALLRTYSKAA